MKKENRNLVSDIKMKMNAVKVGNQKKQAEDFE